MGHMSHFKSGRRNYVFVPLLFWQILKKAELLAWEPKIKR